MAYKPKSLTCFLFFAIIMRMEKRFYVQQANIEGNKITLTEDEHSHLFKVLRLRVGDKAECFYDGSDILNCVVESITKNYSTLKIENTTKVTSNPKNNVTIFQGLPKLDKLELITQKLTELGVTALTPFSSTFCVAKQNDNKIERLKKIVISACKQCGRTKLLEIKPHLTFKQMLDQLKTYSLVVFANETENSTTIKQIFENKQNLKNIAIIIGSEGGFSKEEISSLTNLENAKSVSLGKRILRTETASIAIASIIQYELNEI